MLYRDYAPTQFDQKGLCLPDRQDWHVCPCGRNRDSHPLQESNFHTALKLLGGESDTVEVHRFDHWAVGWVEIMLAHSTHAEVIAKIESDLEDYPILDETDFSEREHAQAFTCWDSYGHAEFIGELTKAHKLGDNVSDLLAGWSADESFSLYCQHANEPYITESQSTVFACLDRAANKITRNDLAALVRQVRKGQ